MARFASLFASFFVPLESVPCLLLVKRRIAFTHRPRQPINAPHAQPPYR